MDKLFTFGLNILIGELIVAVPVAVAYMAAKLARMWRQG